MKTPEAGCLDGLFFAGFAVGQPRITGIQNSYSYYSDGEPAGAAFHASGAVYGDRAGPWVDHLGDLWRHVGTLSIAVIPTVRVAAGISIDDIVTEAL